MPDTTPLRAASYCRTSGEGQRDNTSIGDQKSDVNRLVDFNHWSFFRYYIDECKSGSTIAGRDAFQEMMKDAANGKFDILVVYDISRYGRDGADIIESARTLKRDFGVDVVDTKGGFDTRDSSHTLINFVSAGMAEQERLKILERTTRGRISTARRGKPWSGHPPVGRAFDKKEKRWFVTDKGRAIAEVLRRYVGGESLAHLCPELGISRKSKISDWVWHGQLTGTYKAKFQSPEIGIDIEIPVPVIPEVIPETLLETVRAKLRHNRTHNRVDVKKYLLTGFIRCEHCARALTGQTQDGKVYYRHRATDGCTIKSVRGDALEPGVLDYLYNAFIDEPAFNAAVERAMPSAEHREALEQERRLVEKRLVKKEREIGRLVDAVAKGADIELLLLKQDDLKAERAALARRLEELETEIASMPSAEYTRIATSVTRIHLSEQHRGKDWRQLPYEEVKKFLFHLFGESTPGGKTGIFVRKHYEGNLVATFKGQVEFDHRVVNGRAIRRFMEEMAARRISLIDRQFERAVGMSHEEFKRAFQAEDGGCEGKKRVLKPSRAYTLSGPPMSSLIRLRVVLVSRR
jgi:DNA invertase Pin-like site-specific DNA recombinase